MAQIAIPKGLCLLMLLAAAGCADLEVNALQQQGQISIEPHPTAADSYRVNIIGLPEINSLSPIDRNSEQGHRDIVTRMLGKRCESAEIVREADIEMAPLPLVGRRVMHVLKVTCPA